MYIIIEIALYGTLFDVLMTSLEFHKNNFKKTLIYRKKCQESIKSIKGTVLLKTPHTIL